MARAVEGEVVVARKGGRKEERRGEERMKPVACKERRRRRRRDRRRWCWCWPCRLLVIVLVVAMVGVCQRKREDGGRGG